MAKGIWTVVLAAAKGTTAISLTVANNGKAKVSGLLLDGSEVAAWLQAAAHIMGGNLKFF